MTLLAAGSQESTSENLIQSSNSERNLYSQATCKIFRTEFKIGTGNKPNFLATGEKDVPSLILGLRSPSTGAGDHRAALGDRQAGPDPLGATSGPGAVVPVDRTRLSRVVGRKRACPA